MIRIIVAGTTGSGKSAIAHIIAERLKGLEAQVTVSDAPEDGTKAYSLDVAEAVIKAKKSEVLISTQALNRTASTEQIENAWLSLPASR